MRTRLFHTVVLVGTAMGASLVTVSCSGSDSGSNSAIDGGSDTFPGICDCGSDTFPGIGYRGDTGSVDDTGRWDSIADTWPGIHPADTGPADTGTDTYPGISPVIDSGTDTWPGISPPPEPDAHA